MTCHEVGGVHEVGRADGLVAETQVWAGETARLLWVVGKVGLTILVGVVADNLHRVLVGAHGTVGTEAVELSLEDAFAAERDFLLEGERGEGHVVDNAEGEVVLGSGEGEVLEHGDNLCRGGVFRRKAIASADDERGVLLAVETVLDIEEQRLAVGSGFLGAVKHGDALGCCGHGGEEMLGREGTVEVNRNEAHFLAILHEVVDSFLSGLSDRTHSDDDAVGIGRTVIVEQTVVAAGDAVDFVHVFLHDCGHGIIVLVASLAVLEEHVAVLGHASCDGSVGVESAAAECGECLVVNQGSKLVLIDDFDFLNLVGSAETVKEVHKRNTRLDGRQVGDTREVHNLLNAALGKHGEACLAHRHYILMVTEDWQGVGCESTSRNMEHGREQLACNLVHVGDHQQQTLRRSVGSGQGTRLKRAVNSAGGTALALHFLYHNSFAEDVLAACGSPFVDIFSHSRRRSDGVDCGNLREHVGDMGRSLITITGQEFFFFTHSWLNVIYLYWD